MAQLITSAVALSGGADETTGVGRAYRLTFAGTWVTGDMFTVRFSSSATALVTQIGAGTVTGLVPSFLFTFKDKLNFLNASTWYFSDIGRPTTFNDPNGVGNGFISLANSFGSPEDLVLMLPYQGGVIICSRRTTQIWGVDPAPENYVLKQLLTNVGTTAKLSGQAVGDMDDYFLMDSGVRSVRVRDASNNALIADVGVPIDEIIQGFMQGLSESQKARACSVIEPTSNRYWLYLQTGEIHVFSYFPTSGIAAWSRYRPNLTEKRPTTTTYALTVVNFTGLILGATYAWTPGASETSFTSGSTTLTEAGSFVADATTATASGVNGTIYSGELCQIFSPEKFETLEGRVYARSGDDVFIYGGSSGAQYDRINPLIDLPYNDVKSPATRKSFEGMDQACQGSWTGSIGTNFSDEDDVKIIIKDTDSTFKRGLSMASKSGAFFKVRLTENSSGYARYSRAVVHFSRQDPK